MKRSELKQLIREVIEESIGQPDYDTWLQSGYVSDNDEEESDTETIRVMYKYNGKSYPLEITGVITYGGYSREDEDEDGRYSYFERDDYPSREEYKAKWIGDVPTEGPLTGDVADTLIGFDFLTTNSYAPLNELDGKTLIGSGETDDNYEIEIE